MNPREAITRKVHALLERETRINLHRYPVEISNADGVVVLEGEVADVAAKKLALELAASQLGTMYLNRVFTIERGDYSELGMLMIAAALISVLVPLLAVALVRALRLRTA